MKRLQSSVTVLALLAFSTGGWAGCAAPPETNPGDGDPGPTDRLGTASSPITAADAISRAEEWVSAKLLYCQAANGKPDSDPDCSSVCKREKNADWDPYRSDCSGLVSWAWGLDAPGLTTAEMAPNQGGVTYLIQASSLQPGDAVNTDDSASSEHHVMLFKEWTVQGDTATFIEEPGCSATPDYAHEFTSKVTMSGTSITVAYNGIHFKAIRYNGLNEISSTSSGSPPPTCQVDGVDGDCIDESVCATMDGYKSTAGYCPGPATEKCCTPIDGVSTSAATTSSGSASGGAGGAGGQGGSPPLGSTASSSSAGGVGGAGGSGGAKTKTSTDGGCQLGEGDPTGNLWGLGLGAIGLAVAIRRRRRDR